MGRSTIFERFGGFTENEADKTRREEKKERSTCYNAYAAPGLGFICSSIISLLLCSREIHHFEMYKTHLSLSTSHCDVDESSGVLEALLSTTLWGLLLLLWLNLFLPKMNQSSCSSSLSCRYSLWPQAATKTTPSFLPPYC